MDMLFISLCKPLISRLCPSAPHPPVSEPTIEFAHKTVGQSIFETPGCVRIALTAKHLCCRAVVSFRGEENAEVSQKEKAFSHMTATYFLLLPAYFLVNFQIQRP